MTDSLAERVERGAAWLDSVDPDWPHRIDAATLQLSHCAYCVLGQAVESKVLSTGWMSDAGYWRVYGVVDTAFGNAVAEEWSFEYGFSLGTFGSRHWDDLTALWLTEIEARSGGMRKLDPLPLADVLPHLPGGAA